MPQSSGGGKADMEFLIQRSRAKRTQWYLLGTLVAVELLMSFSFLGYLHIAPISITFAYIPVLLAGVLMGPVESTLLGAVFGTASMWKASAGYVLPADQLFSPFASGRPLESFLLSVGTRTLFGLLVGLLYLAARRTRHEGIWIGVISFLGRPLHAFLVYSAMGYFFPEAGYGPLDVASDFLNPSGLATGLVTMGACLLCWRVQSSEAWQKYQRRMEMVRSMHLTENYHHRSLVLMILVTLCSSGAVAVYFVHRIDYVLDLEGIQLTDNIYSDLLHLQIQFLIGIISLMSLVIVFLIFNRRYATYISYEAKMDALTGTLSRKIFFQMCGRLLEELYPQGGTAGYFLMLDLDWFKEVNDRYGHPAGDQVLREMTRHLRELFGSNGLVGRMGGDEFAVLIYMPVTREELEADLRRFQERMHRMAWEGRHMSCSIGVQPITEPMKIEELYRKADRLLYAAKEQGRGRYVFGDTEKARN